MAYIGNKAAGQITSSSQIINDGIDSQHYAPGSIDNEHLANDAVGTDELANDVAIDTSGQISTTGGFKVSQADITPAVASIYHDSSSRLRITGGTAGYLFQDDTNGTNHLKIDSSGRVTKPNQPAFMAYHDSGDVNYTSTINVDNTHFNTGGHYNTTNSTFTAPIAGKYLFTIQMNANYNTGVPRAYWQINNSNVGNGIHLRGSDASHDGLEMRSYTVILNLSASDAVRIYIQADRFDMFGANSFSGCLLH